MPPEQLSLFADLDEEGSSTPKVFLGCPEWANTDWRGSLFPQRASSAEFLGHYASVFNTVEGNTTFYALPRPELVQRWHEETPEGFRFCLKFPKRISHELRLRHVEEEQALFFRTFAPLEERLGPLFLQLSAAFGPDALGVLERFLRGLPGGFRYAVEVRHPEFFRQGEAEQRLEEVLHKHQVARAVFDTTELFASEATDAVTQEAQRKKPGVPFRDSVTTDFALVRFVGHLEDARNHEALERWAQRVARWLSEGLTPWCFIHTPGDVTAPALARTFHQDLCRHLPTLPELPAFPGEQEPRQMDLF